MENPEEILHHLEEFSKLKPKSIPRELEEYLCFVAKTGDPVYQWSVIKCLFREKLINVITEFYESCPSVDIPPCPNVDIFNYDTMKTFILEKLDTFVAAPFTVQRICELLTTPRKEYNRIDKYMRALEKNILVVSTTEPGHQRSPENGDGFVNGIESDHLQDDTGSNDINIEEMDDAPVWPPKHENDSYQSTSKEERPMMENIYADSRENHIEEPATSSQQALETVITCCPSEEPRFVPAEPAATVLPTAESEETPIIAEEKLDEIDIQVANEENIEIPSVPAIVQRRRNSIEPIITEQIEVDLPTQQVNTATTTTTIAATEEIASSVEAKETEQPQQAEPQVNIEPQPHAGDIIKDDIVLETKQEDEETIESAPTTTSDLIENGEKAGGDVTPEIPASQPIENVEIIVQPKEIDIAEIDKQEELPIPVVVSLTTDVAPTTAEIASDILQADEEEPIQQSDDIHEPKIDSDTSDNSSSPTTLPTSILPEETVESADVDVNLIEVIDKPEIQVFDSEIKETHAQESPNIQVTPEIVATVVEPKSDEDVETPMEVDLHTEPAIESTPNDSTDSADSNN